MNRKWIAGAVLALGLGCVTPSFARAEDWRHDRHDHREPHRHHDNCGCRFDVPISIREVPRRVLDTFHCEARGGRLKCVDHVMREGREFYRFQMIDRHGCAFNIRIACNGAVLGVERA